MCLLGLRRALRRMKKTRGGTTDAITSTYLVPLRLLKELSVDETNPTLYKIQELVMDLYVALLRYYEIRIP